MTYICDIIFCVSIMEVFFSLSGPYTKDPISNNLGEISTLMNLKRTLSLRTLRCFRTLNDSWATKKSFYDDISQSKTFLHQNICIF